MNADHAAIRPTRPSSAPTGLSILVAEDEVWLRGALAAFLKGRGWEVLEAERVSEVLKVFQEERPDAVLLDFELLDGTALDVLPRLAAVDGETPVLILTGHGSIERAVEAVKLGADQFLTKPVDFDTLARLLDRATEASQQRRGRLAGSSRLRPSAPEPFRGSSPAIRSLKDAVSKILPTSVTVLLTGETGSGKGILARHIHSQGPRADAALVDVNCAGFSRDLLESELFGSEKGAFTGATASRGGLLDAAHRGTLFLDEVGDLDPAVQPKLLKVIETKRFRRVGSAAERAVDTRFVFATAQELDVLVREKRFREDLYFRISSVPLRVPPLRERLEDLPELVDAILESLATELSRPKPRLEGAARDRMRRYPWPGNLRELRNVLERAVLLGDGDAIRASDLPLERPAAAEASPFDAIVTLEENERRYLRSVLDRAGGDVLAAAQLLGLPRSTLYFKLKRLSIDRATAGPQRYPPGS